MSVQRLPNRDLNVQLAPTLLDLALKVVKFPAEVESRLRLDKGAHALLSNDGSQIYGTIVFYSGEHKRLYAESDQAVVEEVVTAVDMVRVGHVVR
jgi:hypothetical protein